MRIDVTREAADGLTRERWIFWTMSADPGAALTIRLIEWTQQERPTKRHKWCQEGEGWRSRSHNGANSYFNMQLPAAQVPFPEDVIAEARAKATESIKVTGPFDPPER